MQTLELTTTRPAGCLLPISDLHTLLFSSRSDESDEMRVGGRFAFFTPVCLETTYSGNLRLSAFSRDISRGGIGLLHNFVMERGEICVLHVRCREGELRKRVEAAWCRPAGEGWYLSGWRFIGDAEPTTA